MKTLKNIKTASDTKNKKNKQKVNEKKAGLKYLGGMLFAKMMRGGATALRANAEQVNKLNVFPVPDGDTGDNMRMTIESGIAALENTDSDDLAEVMEVISHGMLLGARGNSGVILSQFFAGIAKGFENSDKADAVTLGKALELGVEKAYTSVVTPTEGTILTVAREAVEYAVSRITPKSSVRTVFADLVKEMHASLNRTPQILSILKDAGVVDSGGAGLFYIMDGLNRVLNGEEIYCDEYITKKLPKGGITPSGFGKGIKMVYGYCTELLLALPCSEGERREFNIEDARSALSCMGDSMILYETDGVVKLHIHTFAPEDVIRYMRGYGEFIDIKIENMNISHTEGVTSEALSPVKKKRAVIAVVSGDGMERIFRQLGTDVIIRTEDVGSPSANDFITAFDAVDAEEIIVLPNDVNIIMAAAQAADMYSKSAVCVIPCKDIGKGYAALSCASIDSCDAEALVDELKRVSDGTTTATVSIAARDAKIEGVDIRSGDAIAILEREIIFAEPDRLTAAKRLADTVLADKDGRGFTLFYGRGGEDAEQKAIEHYIQYKFPEVDAYFVYGGQELYDYIFVIE